MTLIDRLHTELEYYGLAGHPLGNILPGIVSAHHAERYRSRRWMACCLLLTGVLLGGGGALWILWQQLDAIRGSNVRMAAACLNPRVENRTTKAQAQVITQRKENARREAE